jgi:hypothetical protein
MPNVVYASRTVGIHCQWGTDMTMTDAALWLILIALVAIIPIGCVMTRPKKKDDVKTVVK